MSGPFAAIFQHRATREIETIDEWWRKNRHSSPDLFVTELERMLAAVVLIPTLGTPAKSKRAAGVRRVLLPRTRYHVYYRVREETVEVLAVWHAARGTGPGL